MYMLCHLDLPGNDLVKFMVFFMPWFHASQVFDVHGYWNPRDSTVSLYLKCVLGIDRYIVNGSVQGLVSGHRFK